ncbi:MAG TPA: hypothetical protein PL133_06925 [Methylophilaceae bacterium]|nr:hypothetical protein [Methylophilaceae bacterium]HQC29628.1 hypothetical protein [Methylotenera sp.]
MKTTISIATMLTIVISVEVLADENVAQQLIERYATIAKMQDANYAGPSAADGKTFFNREVI